GVCRVLRRRRKTYTVLFTYFAFTRVAATLPSAFLVPLTLTLAPFFSDEQVPSSNVVDALVLTENPFTPKRIDGQVPWSPPIEPSISNSPPGASSSISIFRALIEPSGWRSPTTCRDCPTFSVSSDCTSPRRLTSVDEDVRTVVPATVRVSAGLLPLIAVSVPWIEAESSCPPSSPLSSPLSSLMWIRVA